MLYEYLKKKLFSKLILCHLLPYLDIIMDGIIIETLNF